MNAPSSFSWSSAALIFLASITGGVCVALHLSGNAPWTRDPYADDANRSTVNLIIASPADSVSATTASSGSGKTGERVPQVIVDSLLEELDAYSHPLDPDLPKSIAGTGDEGVSLISDDVVDRLLTSGPSVIQAGQSPGRHLFNLGRLALLHNRLGEAWKFLQMAEKKGSIPAKYYLGTSDLYENPSAPATLIERLRLVTDAEKAGFKPAGLHLGQQLTEEVESLLDEKLAHPQDGQKPKHIFGVPDDELKWLNGSELAQIVKGFAPYIESENVPPRFMFGLGRVAFVHENYATAKSYFEKAASKGSGGAMAYLAKLPENEKHYDFVIGCLQNAIDAGFSDYTTQKALAEALKNRQEKQFNIEIFKGKEVLRHLYSGDVRRLLANGAPLPLPMEPEVLTSLQRSLTLKYVTSLSAFLEREEAGFLAGPQSTMLIGGNAGAVGNMKLQQTGAAAQLLMASKLYGPMSAISNLSKGDPASVDNAMGVLFRGFFGDGFEGPMNSNMELIDGIAHSDARKLIAYYHAGTTEPIEKIYDSIVRFVTDFR